MSAMPGDVNSSSTHGAYNYQQQLMNAQSHHHQQQQHHHAQHQHHHHSGYSHHYAMALQQQQQHHHHQHQEQHHHPSYAHNDEPLTMGGASTVTAPAHYAPPTSARMLMVSSDYTDGYKSSGAGDSVDGGSTKSAKTGTKRSREDLNKKEKQRMFKLNDRINEIRDVLEDAGVKTKKAKQSVLDNALYYIGQLQADLVIAKQKVERAEKEAGLAQPKTGPSSRGGLDSSVYEGAFHQSTTARVVVDLSLKPIAINAAFQKHAGRDAKFLVKKTNLLTYLSKDTAKLEALVKKVRDQNKPCSVMTSAMAAATTGRKGSVVVTNVLLLAAPVSDSHDQLSQVEVSVVPVDNDGEAEKKETVKQNASAVKAESGGGADACLESMLL